jgi:hypothetical protein
MSLYVFGSNPSGDTHFGGSSYPEYFPAGVDEGIVAADFGKVLEVIGHYKYATSANNDGVVEIWKRRLTPTTLAPETGFVKIMEVLDGAWYSSGQEGFGSGYILGWANSGFTLVTDLYLGDFSIAATDIYGITAFNFNLRNEFFAHAANDDQFLMRASR